MKKKLFVGVPIYGGVDSHFFKCWSRLMAESVGMDIVCYPHCGDSLVSRARNHITRVFLESDCTHLLMIDSDLVFGMEHINRIVSHDVEVVAGVYCKKQEGNVQLVLNAFKEPMPVTPEGLMQVKYVGTGFICVARSAFEKMIEKFGDDMWYMLDPQLVQKEYDFWSVGVYEYNGGLRRYLSEDWYFCQRWNDCGGQVWLDRGTVLKHSGNALYPLSYQDKELFNRSSLPQVGGDSVDTRSESEAVNRVASERSCELTAA